MARLNRELEQAIRTALNVGERVAVVAKRLGVDRNVVARISRSLRRVDRMAAPDASPDEVVLGAGAGVDHWALRPSVRAREKRLEQDRAKHAAWLRSIGIEPPRPDSIVVAEKLPERLKVPKARARRVDGARHRLPNDLQAQSPFSKRRV